MRVEVLSGGVGEFVPMVSSLKDLTDELVTLCLATGLGDQASVQSACDVLSQISASSELAGHPAVAAEVVKEISQLKTAATKGKRGARSTTQNRLAALEELSHALYTLLAEQAKQELLNRTPDEHPRLELPPEVDAQIFAEFLSNARLTLDDLEREIEAMRQGLPDSTAAVRRRVHTLKGESGMLGLSDLERVLHLTESFLERAVPPWDRADKMLLIRDWVAEALTSYSNLVLPSVSADKIIELLAVDAEEATAESEIVAPAADTIEQGTLASIKTAGEQSVHGEPAVVEVVQEVTHLPTHEVTSTVAAEPSRGDTQESLPEQVPCPWSQEDRDLVGEFLHEVEEHLAAVDQVLLDTEQSGIDAERVNRLFRAFHTLKGVASFLHLQQFQELTHRTETMLDRIRSGQAIPPRLAVDLVFDATATLRELGGFVQQCLATGGDLRIHPAVARLLDRLQAAIDSKGELTDPEVQPAEPGEKIGEILIRQGVVNSEVIKEALAVQKETGKKIGEALLEKDIPAKAVAHALRAQQLSTEVSSKLKEVVKVDLERVDNLVEAIGELVIVESMVSNAPEIRQLPAHLRNYLGQFAKITRELQELGMCMRMVPVRTEFQKMMRITRDLARRSNKQVRMELAGEGTEMDRIMVEQIADPLVHLIRNAVDHGIEPAEERRAVGKAETGTVRLSACHEGGSIIIEISDDGRGINRERVLAKAVSLGLVDKNASLSDAQIFDLIFAPGFSTAQQVTEISGRGVGMDVVKRNIEAVRGRIITTSVPGRGTTFRLVLPLTLAIIDGMVVRCGDERFILPTLNIVESLQPTKDMLFSISATHENILVRGHTLRLVRLNRLLDVACGEEDPTKALVIIVESLHAQVALLVDEVVMKQQVVIKTLSHDLDESRIFAGAAILSNGRVGLIVNVESLIDASRSAAYSLDTPNNQTSPRSMALN